MVNNLGYSCPLAVSTKYIADRLNVQSTHSGCFGGIIKEGLREEDGRSKVSVSVWSRGRCVRVVL